MKSAPSALTSQHDLRNRVVFFALLAVLVLEQVALTVAFGLPRNHSPWIGNIVSPLTHVFLYSFYPLLVYVIVLAASGRHQEILVRCDSACEGRWSFLALQTATLGLFVAITPDFLRQTPHIQDLSSILLVWLALAFLVLVFSLRSLLTFATWWQLFRSQARLLLFSVVAGMLIYLLVQGFQSLWQPMASGTLLLSSWLLSSLFDSAVVDVGRKLIGTSEFGVHVGWDCSGYEGVGLVLAFGSLYLYLFRSRFHFPRALTLIPLGMVTIWLLNCVRIVALVAIGHFGYPEIAHEGFHSNAGLLFFVLVCVSMMFISLHWDWILNDKVTPAKPVESQASAAIVPFATLMAATLFTPAFSAGFDWLYPLRVFSVGFALAWFWSVYFPTTLRSPTRLQSAGPLFAGTIVVGLGVAVLWIAIYPESPASNKAFTEDLFFHRRNDLAYTWLVFRSIGSIVTVPIAEELFFRGYLLSRIQGKSRNFLTAPLHWHWSSLIVTSLLFGALHDAWIAGFVAGMAYGAVRIYTGSIFAAILCHSTTNAAITIYVFASGNWVLW